MSVRAVIREAVGSFVARNTPITPAAISVAVIAKLTPDERDEALEAAMPYLVRDELRKYRFKGIGKPPPRGRNTWDEHVEERERHSPAPTSNAARDRTTKAQAFKAVANGNPVHDSAMLDTPFHVNGEWKVLGDLTSDDCRTLARDLRESAAKYESRADGWKRLAGCLDEAGAATVREWSRRARRLRRDRRVVPVRVP